MRCMQYTAAVWAEIVCLLALGCSSTTPSTASREQPNSGNKGPCTGDISDCPLASLSPAQWEEACTRLKPLVTPGAKYECTAGPRAGKYIFTSSDTQCRTTRFSQSCPIKMKDVVDCYNAAKADPCLAFDESTGACWFIFSSSKVCAN